MEKVKSLFQSLKLWQVLLAGGSLVALVSLAIFVSPYLRQTAKIKLGSDAGLVVTADRQDALGAFTDTKFTLKSNTDLDAKSVTQNITFFPDIEFDVVEVSPRQFSISPKTPLNDNSVYRLKVLSEAKTYSWAFQTKNDFRIVQTLPKDKGTYVPLNSGIEITFSHDAWENIGWQEKNFEITPAAEGRFERHNRTLVFIPKSLSPDTLYTVKIKKGIKLTGSSDILKDDYTFKFETKSPDKSPGILGFSRTFYEFSLAEFPAFDVYSSGVEGAVSVKVYKYQDERLFKTDFDAKLSIPSWASNASRFHRITPNEQNKILEFKSPLQKQNYSSYFMFPQTLPRGKYLVEASINNVTTQAVVQITDLSAFISVSGTKTLVWVNDVNTGASIDKAKVDFAGKTSDTGTDGVAYFDTPASQVGDNIEVVTISAGDNVLLIAPQNIGYYYYNRDYQAGRRLSDRYWSYIYSDRPAYLPQDTIKLWGLLRDRDDLTKKLSFTLEVTKSDYNSWDFNPVKIFSKDLQTSDLGTYITEIPLQHYSPGNYGIALKINNNIIASSSFTVETYTKPAYQISMDVAHQAIFADQSTTFSGKVSFFEGTPVVGMNLRYSGAKSGTVVTDNSGKYSFTYSPAPSNETLHYPPETSYINIMPSRQEEGLIQTSASVAVYRSRLIFGTTKTDTTNNTGTVNLNLRAVDLSKYSRYESPEDIYAPAVGRKITGQAYEYEYVKREVGTYYDFINKTTSPRYEYDRVQNKISDIELQTNAEGKALYSLNLAAGKSYGIEINAFDDNGVPASQTIYLYGASSGYPRDNYVYLKTSKTGDKAYTYAVGERVDLTLMKGETPMVPTSKDRFLYLWAQRGIKSYQVTSSSTHSFNYPDAFIPNVYVQAVRFTGKTYEVAEKLFLNFDTDIKKISLDITQNKLSYAPGETAKVSVVTKNSTGLPVSAEVNLNLIDEAYFKLFPTIADPLSRIYSAVDSDILATYYSHRYPLDAGGAEAGGCFLSGTDILMSDGSTKSIENIKVGDKVKTLESHKSSKLVSAKVSQIFSHTVSGYLLINNNLRVTGEHNLYINGRWMMAKEARVGDSFLNSKGLYQEITSVENMPGIFTVFNFEVAKYHTYIANGFYAHNDKGRELFVDNAFFGNIITGSDGKGSVDIKLPDNLTSWRITSQAISKDLQSGSATAPLVVKQPFFVDAVLNTEYLAADKPIITVRPFGEDLSPGEPVNISVQIPTLEIDKQVSAKAFEAVQINLGSLKAGDHKITITANSTKHTDKLIRSFKVIDSRLKLSKAVNVNLSTDTIPSGSADSYTKLIFSDQNIGRFFPALVNINYSWGDRLDQKLGRIVSGELIKKYFDDTIIIDPLDISLFRDSQDGYGIYPYASTDLELSSFVAALAPDRVDTYGLANYFYKAFSESKDTESAAIALFGLASLDEPVLLLVNNLSNTSDISPLTKIYLAMAQAQLGDTENAYSRFQELVTSIGVTQDNLLYIQTGKDKDSYLRATAVAAALASMVDAPQADSLFAYTIVNGSRDLLFISPQLLTIKNRLARSNTSAVSFDYTLDGKTISKKLDKGATFSLLLAPSQLSSIKFSNINGNVGLTTSFLASVNPDSAELNKTVTVKRTYSVSDKQVTDFSSSDLVKVSLITSMAEISQDGCYQVTDILPSGLKPITSVYGFVLDTEDVWYPYEINGQKVSFCIGKARVNKPIVYYARVVSPGEYKSEGALIQSLISPSIYNLSPDMSVSIK